MQFIRPDINIDFIGKRKLAYIFSAILILVGVVSLVLHKGPKYGIDFAGGTLIQLKFQTDTPIAAIKDGLGKVDLGGSTVQYFGEETENEFLVRTDRSVVTDEAFSSELEKALNTATGNPVDIRRIEMVGPQVGKDLQEQALFAIFYSLLFITIYISGRFEQKWILSGVIAIALTGVVYFLSLFEVSIPVLILAALILALVLFWFMELKYAMGAIVSLLHDVMITVGMFSLFEKDFTLPIVAAILTIIGYSLNDTIIVYDRIRENLRKYHKKPLDFLINRSINETLSRTILTSGTTLVVVLFLWVMGGNIIHDFAFALLVGIGVGTYSSVFVASPIILAWQGKPRK